MEETELRKDFENLFGEIDKLISKLREENDDHLYSRYGDKNVSYTDLKSYEEYQEGSICMNEFALGAIDELMGYYSLGIIGSKNVVRELENVKNEIESVIDEWEEPEEAKID